LGRFPISFPVNHERKGCQVALQEKHRSSIYQTLAPLLGEEEAQALLSQFPAREFDEPVTKEFVRAELAELRGDLRGEIGSLRAEMHETLRRQTVWLSGTVMAAAAVVVAGGAIT